MATRTVLAVLLAIMMATSITFGCGPKESGIMIGQAHGSKVQSVSAGNLITRFFNYADSTVKSELVFNKIMKISPQEGFVFVETNSDYGTIYLLAHIQKYGNKIKKLRNGDKFTVIGVVSAVPVKGFTKAPITIIAN